jgi:hypothetical protein
VVWSAGVTEPGSSGSGIWNPSNHRLIGTLSGGGSDCTTPSSPDCYGKFSVAWASGSSSADRLRDWLDPLNTGVTGVDGNDPAGVAVVVADGYSVVAESCTPANNAIDPGETVTLGFNLKNNGGANTTNLVATLLPGGGVVSPSGPQTYGVLVAGGPLVSRPFTFTANAACGGTVTARLRVQDGTGKIRTNGFLVPLGIGGTTVIFSQNFDGVAAPGLPSGWSSSITGAGTAWATTTAAADTAPNSVFADDPGHVTDNLLVSPPITITSASSQHTFRHSYNTEDRYDGGVLEISSNGGTFKDILSAGGSFLANGYNQSIPTTFSSPIGGRAAWSGNSGGFVTTTVSLPASAAGKSIRLRWRLGSDASVAGSGWHVDTVSIAQTIYQCCSLAATDNAAPALIITSHVDLQQVATTNITVSGTASDAGDGDNGIASVTVKGIRAVGDTTTGVGVAAWSRTISLVNGINPVKVVATDFAGNATTNVIRLILDPFRPTVSIVSPTAGQRVTNTFSPVVARGTAADNVQVTNVQVWLNAGPWTNAVSANGWSNWTASIVPVARTNLLKAFSVDEAGRKSSTNAVSFIYVVTSPLTLVTNGIGTITRGFSGSVLEVGRSYSVTAVPGAGQVFSNWDGSVTSTNPMLTFVMQTNMILTANFIPNPFLRARGTYYGLFSETNRAQARSGFFTITLDENGSFSASLLRGTNTFPFTGHFDLSGLCSATVISAGTNSWNVTMALDLGTAEDLIGVIGNAQWLADLRAHRAVFNSVTNPATRLAGKYTLIIPGATNEGGFAPEGDGYGAVTVGPGGYVTLNGSLADGNALSQVVPLSRNGDWPLYQSRYSGKGSVWGWLAFDTNTPSAGISGLVSWIKQAVPAAIYYPAGFTNLSLALTNGALIFEGGNLSASFTNLVTLTTTNRVLNDSPNTLNLAFTPSNGVFSGSVKVPGTTRTNAFKGALLQDLDSGYGFFLGTNRSGRVFLRPEP